MGSADVPEHKPVVIRSVAVIGAGPSGLPAIRHLVDAGLEVTAFERSHRPGGIWQYSPEHQRRAVKEPATRPSQPKPISKEPGVDVYHVSPAEAEEQRKLHAPPPPMYLGLSNNVPLPSQNFQDFPWPKDSPWYANQHVIAGYLQNYAKHFNLDKHVQYSTRVEKVTAKHGPNGIPAGWNILTSKLQVGEDQGDSKVEVKQIWESHDFDAVVVATGHYAEPKIPAFDGLEEWAKAYPDSLWHSKDYRSPAQFSQAKSAVIVGASASGNDIAKELAGKVPKVYHVIRNTPQTTAEEAAFKAVFSAALPTSNIQKPGIRRLIVRPGQVGQVEFDDGDIVEADTIILATGYHFSFPFLGHLQRPDIDGPAPEEVVVTKGDAVLNLHRDIFYIPNPTLAFSGIPINTSAFNCHEYAGLAAARVFSGAAELPSKEEMKAEYQARVAAVGEGRALNVLGGPREISTVAEIVQWLDSEAARLGKKLPPVQGHSEEWLAIGKLRIEGYKAREGLISRVVLDNGRFVRERTEEELAELTKGK